MKVQNIDVGFRVISTSNYTPQSFNYSNLDLLRKHPAFADQSESRLDIFSRRITEEFGFENRCLSHFPGTPLANNELTSEDLAFSVLEDMQRQAPAWQPNALTLGTTTTTRYCGSQGTVLAGKMKWEVASYETKAGCSTSLATLGLALDLLPRYKKIAVVCSEILSKMINPNARDDWFGLADGSGGLYLEHEEKNPDFRVEKSIYFTRGQHFKLYTTPGVLPPNALDLNSGHYYLQGDHLKMREIVTQGYRDLLDLLLPSEQEKKSIDWVIPHQVNKQLTNEVYKHNKLSGSIIWDSDKIGNIGGSSIIYSLAKSIQNSTFQRGDKILMMSVGGGLSLAGQIWVKC